MRRWTCRCRPGSGTPPTCTRQVSVSACAWAGSSSGHGAPTSASRHQLPAAARARPVSGSTTSGSGGGSGGRRAAMSSDADRVAVVEQGDPPVRGRARSSASGASGRSHPAVPGRVPGQPTGAAQPRRSGPPGPGSGTRAPARSGHRPAGPAPRPGRSAGPARRPSRRSSPKNTARPASALRFLIRWLPPTSVSRFRRRNPAWADRLATYAASIGLPATRSRCRPQYDQARRAAGYGSQASPRPGRTCACQDCHIAANQARASARSGSDASRQAQSQ